MKNNPLDDIIKCQIEISSPASSDATFDRILIVVAGSLETSEKEMKKTIAISKAEDLLEYGFTVGDAAYIAATTAFSQNPSPDELYVCIRKVIESEKGKEGETELAEDTTLSDTEALVNGDEATGRTYEDIRITLARAASEVGFYGIHLTEFEKNTGDLQNAIAWAESNEKLFCFEYQDYENFPLKNTSYYRSFCLYSGQAEGYDTEQPAENQYAALAWMAKCFGYDPGTETWHLKELASIVPSVLRTDQKKKLEEQHINTFLRYAGSNCTIGGYTLAGEWVDVIRFRDWLKAEMQNRIFQILKANRKVPFTDQGIGLIEGAMESVLKDGQDIGGIAATEYDREGKERLGFQVFVPKASDLTEAERKSRKLTGCRYTARLAGAIHAVEIEGYLTF